MNYSLIFRLPLHWWLAATLASSEHLFVSVERLGVLTSVLFSGVMFCGSNMCGSGFSVWFW